MNILTCVVIGAVSVTALPAAIARPHYSLRADFSTTENPNGAWAYLYNGAPIPCMLHQGYIPELTGWCCQQDWGAAVAAITDTPSVSWHDAMVGDIVIHVASEPTQPIAVRWTAPQDGTITLGGVAWDASFDPSRDSGWTLRLNGTLLAQRGTIVGTFRTDLGATFSANLEPGQGLGDLAVAAGDTLVFSTYNIGGYGHFMGVDIGIEFEPVVSCPGDTNGDGHVDFLDLNRVLSSFGAHEGDPTFIPGADLNGDDAVDFLDLNFVLSFFGQSC